MWIAHVTRLLTSPNCQINRSFWTLSVKCKSILLYWNKDNKVGNKYLYTLFRSKPFRTHFWLNLDEEKSKDKVKDHFALSPYAVVSLFTLNNSYNSLTLELHNSPKRMCLRTETSLWQWAFLPAMQKMFFPRSDSHPNDHGLSCPYT